MPAHVSNTRLAFGLYEIDLKAGELWKAGFRIKLQSQPFKVLAALLERPGEAVTREELQLQLWGPDTVVDFDHSLATAINKIREALGDSAENPRFVETLSRKGYRFIAPVGPVPSEVSRTVKEEAIATIEELPVTASLMQAGKFPYTPAVAQPAQNRLPFLVWGLLTFIACVTVYFMGIARSTVVPAHITQLTRNGHLASGVKNIENLAPIVTDGTHLYAADLENGRSVLSAVSQAGGSIVPITVPKEVESPTLGDISPDGSHLLIRNHLSPEREQPLWVVPTAGGSALRVGNVLAHDATWMPDGKGILYASGDTLYVTQLMSNSPVVYATLPGRAFWMRWSPNGRLLRLTLIDSTSFALSLWQLTDADRNPKRMLAGFSEPSSECCGVWTADGRSFVFQSMRGGNHDLWKLSGDSAKNPLRLTDGPLQFRSPVASRSGGKIFFLGVDSRSELHSLSGGTLTPERGFLAAAVHADFSRDGQWVAWTDSVDVLWRARIDGTELMQVTPDSLNVFLARWSPDGSRLALMAREPGKPWQIYMTSFNGGEIKPLLHESRSSGDPSWSPDGQSLVFGRVNDALGRENLERSLQILNLKDGKIEPVPHSDGLFSPRWSPDGHYIAAMTLDQRQVRIFDIASRSWSRLPVSSGSDLVWSSDSRALFLHASLDASQPILRVTIPSGQVQELAHLYDSRENDASDFIFVGLMPDDRPLIRTRVFTGNVYSLDLK